MKRAVIAPPEVISVAVTAPASAVLNRRSRSKRSLSLNVLTSHSSSSPCKATAGGGGTASSADSPPATATAVDASSDSPPSTTAPPPPSETTDQVEMTDQAATEEEVSATPTTSATTPMRVVSDAGPTPPFPPLAQMPPPLLSSNNSGSSKILRKVDSEREMIYVPLAVAYLEQVKMDISVTKQQSDIRYVMTVHHVKLDVKWRHPRSFDEYRKLQQRLLKLLSHGHFCSADCPWMFTFLKSYFPKKHIFNFSSARVVAARKAALERFFVAAQSFLLNRANHGCGFMTVSFANELVGFIYGDMIKQYPLEQLTNVQTSVSGCVPGLRRVRALTESHASSCSDDELSESFASSSAITVAGGVQTDGSICQICDASLYGEAFAGKYRANSSLTGCSFSSLESLELDMIAASLAASAAGVISVSPTSSSWSSTGSSGSGRRKNTHYVTTLECGHQFHDECVVPKLNETLCCPTCGHLEVK